MEQKEEICIIVDTQVDFTTGSLGSEAAQKIIPNVIQYIKDHQAVYILTRDTHRNNYLESREGKYLPVPHCIKDTEGWQIDKGIMDAVRNSDNPYFIIDKNTFGSFEPVDIIKSLYYDKDDIEGMFDNEMDGHSLNITLMGLDTDICVISNALIIKAAFPEADVNIVENCCAGVTPESHDAAIMVAKSCQINII